jgi:hypothetical protein
VFAAHGYDAEEARIRARLLYLTRIGHYALDVEPQQVVPVQSEATDGWF